MVNPKQYLDWHGQQWRVRIKVPDRLRSIIGKSKLVHPLHTDNLKEAETKKWPVVASFKATLKEAQRIHDVDKTHDPIEAEALKHRFYIDPDDMKHTDNYDAMIIRAYEIEKSHGYSIAKKFVKLADHSATPMMYNLDDFLRYKKYKAKSVNDLKRVLTQLSDWLGSVAIPPYIESIDRKIAGRFISEHLLVGRGVKKARAYKGFLSQYWDWQVRKGLLIDSNPWVDQPVGSIKDQSSGLEHDGGKRPYTDKEMVTLLSGTIDPLLSKLIPIAALSGMRIEEICQLRVRDCTKGVFTVRQGKTANARRSIPIHSDLKEIVAQCLNNEKKKADDYLIDSLPAPPPSRTTRSDPAVKKFTRYRRKCGIDERPNGKPKSNVDFHSFRRWFVRQVRDALINGASGFDMWTLVDVVGHSDKDRPMGLDLSQRTYAGSDPIEPRKLLVEAVKLPKFTTSRKDT